MATFKKPSVPADKKVTDEEQAIPDAVRECFLQGVLAEAGEQGYSKYSTGRLYVQAVRSWEKR